MESGTEASGWITEAQAARVQPGMEVELDHAGGKTKGSVLRLEKSPYVTLGDFEIKVQAREIINAGTALTATFVQELLGHPGVDLVRVYVLEDDSGHAVSGFCTFDDLVAPPVLRKIKCIGLCREEIAAIEPDLIVVAGFSQIIPQGILDVPPLGTIGFHSAVLPGRRGCSPIIWAIVDGLTESGVTMFYMAAGIDAGDVIDVERFEILASDQAAQVLDKADQATLALFRRHLDQILDGNGAAGQA